MKNLDNKIYIVQYKWAGAWGPFKVKIPCGECAVTQNIIEDVIQNDFKNYQDKIEFKVLEWLTNWYKVVFAGGWHAPIVTINGRVIFQGQAIDRGFLASEVRKELVKYSQIPNKGVLIYTKDGCKYCNLAKELLHMHNIEYVGRDVVKDPLATAEIFFHTKKFFPANKPVTTPQIWMDGKYVGGAEELQKLLESK